MARRVKKTGAPSKLTPDVHERIVTCIKGGNYRDVAAQWAGITQHTFNNWMRRGMNDSRGKYRRFFLEVIQAEQEAEVNMVRIVERGAILDPKHAEWWLERKAYTRWGRKDSVLLRVQNMTDEQLLDIIAGAAGTDSGGDAGATEAGCHAPLALPAPTASGEGSETVACDVDADIWASALGI